MYVSRKFVLKTAVQDYRWCCINICIQAWQESASPGNFLPHMNSFKCKMSFQQEAVYSISSADSKLAHSFIEKMAACCVFTARRDFY